VPAPPTAATPLLAAARSFLRHNDWAPSSVVEHVTFNHVVLGSIPRGPTN
jgi:hypothetical protein